MDFKFPRTDYLDPDKYDLFGDSWIIVEEKIDGSNLGISFNDDAEIILQNRGALCLNGWKWNFLRDWTREKINRLFDVLGSRYILFGEWMVYKHSIYYDKLPDYFIGFDVYDKFEKNFLAVWKRNEILKSLGLYKVPFLASASGDEITFEELQEMLEHKAEWSNENVEGIYIRKDVGLYNELRFKLVRKNFIQTDVHWSNMIPVRNRIYNQETILDFPENQ